MSDIHQKMNVLCRSAGKKVNGSQDWIDISLQGNVIVGLCILCEKNLGEINADEYLEIRYLHAINHINKLMVFL